MIVQCSFARFTLSYGIRTLPHTRANTHALPLAQTRTHPLMYINRNQPTTHTQTDTVCKRHDQTKQTHVDYSRRHRFTAIPPKLQEVALTCTDPVAHCRRAPRSLPDTPERQKSGPREGQRRGGSPLRKRGLPPRLARSHFLYKGETGLLDYDRRQRARVEYILRQDLRIFRKCKVLCRSELRGSACLEGETLGSSSRRCWDVACRNQTQSVCGCVDGARRRVSYFLLIY